MRHFPSILLFAILIVAAFGCVHGQSGVDRDEELVKAEKHDLLCKGQQKSIKTSKNQQDPVATQRAGGLTAQEIMTVIRTNLNDVKKCYETVLDHNPSVRGKVDTFFIIGKSGSVQEVCFDRESELIAASLLHCIREDIKGWVFPKPRKAEPVNVNYPFVFSPK